MCEGVGAICNFSLRVLWQRSRYLSYLCCKSNWVISWGFTESNKWSVLATLACINESESPFLNSFLSSLRRNKILPPLWPIPPHRVLIYHCSELFACRYREFHKESGVRRSSSEDLDMDCQCRFHIIIFTTELAELLSIVIREKKMRESRECDARSKVLLLCKNHQLCWIIAFKMSLKPFKHHLSVAERRKHTYFMIISPLSIIDNLWIRLLTSN